jgi:hypothetical protein
MHPLVPDPHRIDPAHCNIHIMTGFLQSHHIIIAEEITPMIAGRMLIGHQLREKPVSVSQVSTGNQ